jgi:hypothetical protein
MITKTGKMKGSNSKEGSSSFSKCGKSKMKKLWARNETLLTLIPQTSSDGYAVRGSDTKLVYMVCKSNVLTKETWNIPHTARV